MTMQDSLQDALLYQVKSVDKSNKNSLHKERAVFGKLFFHVARLS